MFRQTGDLAEQNSSSSLMTIELCTSRDDGAAMID